MHNFHQILKSGAVVGKDRQPLLLEVPPEGLLVVEVAGII
jgi:hypothetical protein